MNISIQVLITFLLAAAVITASSGAHADWGSKNYKVALDAANQYVQKQKLRAQYRAELHDQASADHNVSSMYLQLIGPVPPAVPHYKVGDQWDTLSYQELPLAGIEDAPIGRSALFHSEVKEVNSKEIDIRVTQKSGYGVSVVDPKVEYIDTIYSPDLVLQSKFYKLAGYHDPIPVSPDNLRVGVSPIEGFAFELPPILDAEKDAQCDRTPELPATLKAAALQASYPGFSSKDICWKNDDFFGRHLQSVWKSGQLAPIYLKTTQGVSILAHQEVR